METWLLADTGGETARRSLPGAADLPGRAAAGPGARPGRRGRAQRRWAPGTSTTPRTTRSFVQAVLDLVLDEGSVESDGPRAPAAARPRPPPAGRRPGARSATWSTAGCWAVSSRTPRSSLQLATRGRHPRTNPLLLKLFRVLHAGREPGRGDPVDAGRRRLDAGAAPAGSGRRPVADRTRVWWRDTWRSCRSSSPMPATPGRRPWTRSPTAWTSPLAARELGRDDRPGARDAGLHHGRPHAAGRRQRPRARRRPARPAGLGRPPGARAWPTREAAARAVLSAAGHPAPPPGAAADPRRPAPRPGPATAGTAAGWSSTSRASRCARCAERTPPRPGAARRGRDAALVRLRRGPPGGRSAARRRRPGGAERARPGPTRLPDGVLRPATPTSRGTTPASPPTCCAPWSSTRPCTRWSTRPATARPGCRSRWPPWTGCSPDAPNAEEHPVTDDAPTRRRRPAGAARASSSSWCTARTATRTGSSGLHPYRRRLTLRTLRPHAREVVAVLADGSRWPLTHEYDGDLRRRRCPARTSPTTASTSPTTAAATSRSPSPPTTPTASCPRSARSTCT